jgi:coenzyme PQQ biosynthesis protein PqqD
MTADAVPAFRRGVRLRAPENGTALLLVPEGVVELNASAAAALALVDGKRSLADIAGALSERAFDVPAETIVSDVGILFERLRARSFIAW